MHLVSLHKSSFANLRILLTGDFIFSSSFDKTAKAWLFDVSDLGEGDEDRACIKTFKVNLNTYVELFCTNPFSGSSEGRVSSDLHPIG